MIHLSDLLRQPHADGADICEGGVKIRGSIRWLRENHDPVVSRCAVFSESLCHDLDIEILTEVE